MINRGLLEKTIRESARATILFGLAFFAFEFLVAIAIPRWFDGMAEQMVRIPFVRNLISALLGADVGERLSATALGAFPWVHPVALTITWGHEIVFCTRVPAGEVDRGTADVLMGLPVSRWQLYCCESLVWLVSGIVVVLFGFVGAALGQGLGGADDPPSLARLVPILTNLFALYLAVGGLAWLVSAMFSRRLPAMGLIFAIVLAAFFLNFLGEFWAPVQRVAFLSFLDYYRPFEILTTDRWPVFDLAILTACGVTLWVAGGMVLARRDIRTT